MSVEFELRGKMGPALQVFAQPMRRDKVAKQNAGDICVGR